MRYKPNQPTRQPLRLRGYNYGQAGVYFVTICTQERLCHFGDTEDGVITLSPTGQIVQDVWDSLPSRFYDVATDAFVIMPNHVHGTLILGADSILGPKTTVGAQFIAPGTPRNVETSPSQETPEGAMNRAPTLGECVRTLKAASTRLIRLSVLPEFAWQRNYYERIIRNETELWHVRQYIASNPTNWASDSNNPAIMATPLGSEFTPSTNPLP